MRDVTTSICPLNCIIQFLLTRPMRDVTHNPLFYFNIFRVSTHTPHAGRDHVGTWQFETAKVSTHTPHAGRDDTGTWRGANYDGFYSHAPCGT